MIATNRTAVVNRAGSLFLTAHTELCAHTSHNDYQYYCLYYVSMKVPWEHYVSLGNLMQHVSHKRKFIVN